MILSVLQKNLNTTEKFYSVFKSSPEGLAVLETAHQKFSHSMPCAREYILEGIHSWLLEHLSDDEMDTGLLWLNTMNPSLSYMISVEPK